MINQENKKIYSRFLDEFYNKKNLSIVDKLVHANVFSHSPFLNQKPGASGLKIAALSLFQSFPDLKVKVEDLIAADSKVVARLIISGTHKQDFMGIPATNKKFIYPEISIVKLKDKKIIEHWAVSDLLEMMNQLEDERI